MANTALVTGASAGIGTEFARYHAAQGGDLVITARRAAPLEALKTELEGKHGISFTVIAMDLGTAGAADQLYEQVSASHQIDILINNAGFGGLGLHVERPLAEEQAMVDLNIKALVTLSHRFGADMAARGHGHILNVGSTAGFAPGPRQAVYFATKAFVNSYTQALSHELSKRGVTCTALAPGYVKTEFAEVAGLEGTQLVASGGRSAASVAKFGYDAMKAGKLIVINEASLSVLMNWIAPLLPRRMMLNMMDKMQQK